MSAARSGFELREHPADVALYAWGDTPEALFASAARGFYAAMGELRPADSSADERVEISLSAPDRADLLGDFLSELLFLFDARGVQVTDLAFAELDESRVRAVGRLQPIDMKRSQFDAGIKAVTRHNLAIESRPGRLETTIILDI
ncbi:MAG TPA: archease [Phycisphaerae bacterium]|nr:archease [Phycisphaerae bacterium]